MWPKIIYKSLLFGLAVTTFCLRFACAAESEKPDPAVCRALTTYQPGADVDYKPGVDVHGRYVAQADVADGASSVELPKKIVFPLTVSLAKILNLDTTKPPYNQLGAGTEAKIGEIAVEGNNVTFNGKSLSNAQQSNLAVLCEKADK